MEQEYTESQKEHIADLRETLAYFSEKIDKSIAKDGEDDNQTAFCYRLLHAHTSALIFLLGKNQTNVEFKDPIARRQNQ